MIFPIWYFDDYSQIVDLQAASETAAAEEVVQDSTVGRAPVVHPTAVESPMATLNLHRHQPDPLFYGAGGNCLATDEVPSRAGER